MAGNALTKQALDAEHIATVVTHHPEKFPLRAPHLNGMGGDVFDVYSRSVVAVATFSGQPGILKVYAERDILQESLAKTEKKKRSHAQSEPGNSHQNP